MEGVQSLGATLKRTEKDQTTADVKHFTGFTKYMRVGAGDKAQNLAVLEMTPDGKKDFSERIVSSGSFIYQFIPSEKEIVAHEVKAGQTPNDSLLGFLLGMKKNAVKQRFDLKLDHTDKNYIYVMVYPRFDADKVDFKRAQIVLFKEGKNAFFPCRLWFESPNSTETTWDVSDIKANDPASPIDRREFDAPTPPKDWKLIKAPADAETPPRVVRPSGN
jgi:TIGR03009 family protein